MADVLAGKRLEVLKDSIGKLARVAVLSHPQLVASTRYGQKAKYAARRLVATLFHGNS